MYQLKSCLFGIFFFLSGWSFECFSQIVATPSAGCAPLSVNFSGPAGATNVFWNLGTGIGSSTLSNPNPIYGNPGTYNITYTALVNGSPVNYSKQLVVNTGPNGSFSFVLPSSHCAPMTVNFSGSGGSPGSTFNWAFGDLGSSLNTNGTASHVYTGPGSFVPLMIVVDAVSGCTAVAKAGTVNVSSSPFPIISSSNGFIGCSPPFTTNITGTMSASGSPIAGPLSQYNWQFGGGSPGTSGAASPGNVSFSTGQHTVSLTVTDNNSCSNTATAVITALSASITAAIQPTVCFGTLIDGSVTSTSDQTTWKFSDGSVHTRSVAVNVNDTLANLHYVQTAGTIIYTVSISPGGICPSVSYTNSFFVEKVTVNFVPITPGLSTCQSPHLQSLSCIASSNSGCSLTYIWKADVDPARATDHISPLSFTTTTPQSPTYTLTQGSLNPYTRFQNFAPVFRVLVTSNCQPGCQSEVPPLGGMVNVQRPTAAFNKDKREGCAPLLVTFRDTCHSAVSPIASYTFYNGATPQQSITGTNIFPLSLTYTTPGTYYPYLKIKTLSGCDAISFVDTIKVVNPPVVNGSVATPSACAGSSVTINLSGSGTSIPASSGIDHWHVTTDNNFFSGCITNSSPSFPFTHVGTHTIGITAYQNACKSLTILPQTIVIKGPYGKMRHETNCTGDKKEVKFMVHLQDVETATLSFGDSQQQVIPGTTGASISFSTTHVYGARGVFTASLVSKNSLNASCPIQTFTTSVKVREPDANIRFNGQPIPALPNALACTRDRYLFDASSSVDAYTGCGSGYIWDLKGPGFTMPTMEDAQSRFASQWPPALGADTVIFNMLERDSFRVAGNYTISLRIRDDNGCTDTETKVFRISSAKPSFTFNVNPVCLSAGSVQLINTTQAGQLAPDAITDYTFTFGDTPLGVLTSTDPLFNPVYSYAFAVPPSQTFQVRAIAKNNLGCIDTAMRILKVNNPAPNLQPSSLYPCLPKFQSSSVSFSASPGYVTYSLSFGDPPSSPTWSVLPVFNTVSHAYTSPGTFVSTLTVVDAGSCSATQVQTITVVGQPTANIIFANDMNRFCLPGLPTMISTSTINVTPITNYFWSMSGQQALGTATLSNIVPSSGVHTVNLTVSVNGYCPSTDTALVFVSDPRAKMTLDKRTICLGDIIKVSITDSADVYAWQWFFGDNVPQREIIARSFLAQITKTLSYTYSMYPSNGNDGKVTMNLLYYAAGPTCLRTDTASLLVIKHDANFDQTQNIYKHCLDIPDTFTGQATNPHNLSLQYNWTFNDKDKAEGTTATYNFTNTGTNLVRMDVSDSEYGCKTSTTKSITVLPLPTAKVSVKDSACPDEVVIVTGTGTPGISGALTLSLSPLAPGDSLRLMPGNTFSLPTRAYVSTEFTLNVKDDNGCVSKDVTDRLFVQPPAPVVNWDTTVIIGQTVQLNSNAGPGYTYTWTPQMDDLNCSSCHMPNPISSSTVDITYTVIVEDPLRCSMVSQRYKINILPKTSVDVPTAFTPNGDGINDLIYADGWGIKKLVYFKIFNRWGQQVFYTNDLKTGWDGRYNGEMQNIETYVYQVSVETYTGQTINRSGTLKLLK